mgnify:CR=1 FL=1
MAAVGFWKGDWSAERDAKAAARREKQLAEEADLKDFIRRFSANASKSTQAQSRAKLLEKLQKEMLKTVSAATEAPVRASISTPVRLLVEHSHSTLSE